MSSNNNSETKSASPGPTTTTKSSSESSNNENLDGRDLLHSLKGQVSFAKQCLGLLQNQMKHAMDTLEILQDQVIKAQSTIDKLERKGAKGDQKTQSVSSSNDNHPSADELSPGAVPVHSGHRMVVVDSTGQPLYTIDKSAAASYGVPVQHQGGHCHCPSCNNVGLGHPVFITEQNQQLIALHPGQAVYHIDGKQVSSPGSSIHESHEKKNDNHTSSASENSHPKKRKHSITDGEDSHSPKQIASESNTGQREGKSSPITSQLLQVLDVLQNAGDDDSKESVLTRSSRNTSAIPFTGPVPLNPVHSASGTGILAVGRRCRKQDMVPFKREESSMMSHIHKSERDYPELMKVPPPVLAATLEPDFLVVPGNSYFSDSPPSSACGSGRERQAPPERRSSETRTSLAVEVKKEHIEIVEPRRSSSGSSMSQISETSSRSPSESSERSANVDVHKRGDTTCEIVSHINKISDHENTSRDHCPHENISSHSNGETSKTHGAVSSLGSNVTRTTPSRISLLSVEKDASEPVSPSQMSPKKSPVRLIKVSPLNSAITGSSGMELRRPSLEYTSNHGIVRISSAKSVTSPLTSPKHTSASDPSTFSNNVSKAAVTSYVNNSDSESDLPMVTTYSVAQISNADDRKCTSPSKRPNILSRNRSQNNKKDIPQGIVVLVPTIEDAKQLIKSSGNNQGSTPVLVPQNVLNEISSNGESTNTNADSHASSSYVGKRGQYSDNSLSYSRPKRGLSEPMVID